MSSKLIDEEGVREGLLTSKKKEHEADLSPKFHNHLLSPHIPPSLHCPSCGLRPFAETLIPGEGEEVAGYFGEQPIVPSRLVDMDEHTLY